MATFPDVVISEVNWRPVGNTSEYRSDLNASEQVLELPGTLWRADVQINRAKSDDVELLTVEAFLAGLKGRSTLFEMWPLHRPGPSGSVGTPTVNGAGQLGETLITQGWTPSTNGLLTIGQFFSFGTPPSSELKQLRAAVNSDAGGNATLSFFPPIRFSPVDTAPLTTFKPLGSFRLVSNDGVRAVYRGKTGRLSFAAIESFKD